MSEKSKASQPRSKEPVLESIRDLSDFCNAWPELCRWVSDDALSGLPAHANTIATIRWLVLLADRVCYDFDE